MSDNEITIPATTWHAARMHLYVFLSAEEDDEWFAMHYDSLERHGLLAPLATGRITLDDLFDRLWSRRERIRAATSATGPDRSPLNAPARLNVRPSD